MEMTRRRVTFPVIRANSMHRLLVLLLVCGACFTNAQSLAPPTTSPPGTLDDPIPKQNATFVLSERTFTAAVRAFDPLFVLFDSSDRYGSLTLLRRFSDAAQTVRLYNWTATRTSARFAWLDVSQLNSTLPHELKLLGLPALLLFHCQPTWPASSEQNWINTTISSCAQTSGGVEVYTGGRSSMELQRFALGQPLREPMMVSTKAELFAIVKSRPFVVLFVVDGVDSQAFIDCRVLAQIDSDSSVYTVSTNETIFSKAKARGQQRVSDGALRRVPALVVFREFGRERVVYDSDWNKSALLQFIQRNRYNLISTYTETDGRYFYDPLAAGHVLIFSDPNASYHPALVSGAQDIAAIYYNASNSRGGYVLRFLIVSKDQVALKNALFVLDDQFPTILVVQNVSQPPTRMPFIGSETLGLIQNGSIARAIRDQLENLFTPFTTTDLSSEDDSMEQRVDWRDYSDLFENRKAPFLIRPPKQLAPAPPLAATDTLQTIDRRRLVVSTVDTSSLIAARDEFLSIFTAPASRSSTSPIALDTVELRDLSQLQSVLAQHERNEVYHRHRCYVLVVLHSPRCYACRQAMDALRSLPPVNGVVTLALVNVDRVDVREWPFRFQWLPGIFLFSGADQVAMFPSRSSVTVDTLVDFVRRATAGPQLTTSQIS